MIPLDGAELLGFLHFLSLRLPHLAHLRDLSYEERWQYARQFSEHSFRIGTDNSSRWEELFRPFLEHCKQAHTTSFDGRKIVRTAAEQDVLERFKSTRCHGLLFYTSDHVILREYLRTHWHSLSQTLGNRLDLYDFLVHQDLDVGSFDRGILERLKGIPGLSVDAVQQHGLPCLFLWSEDTFVCIGLSAHAYSETRLSQFFNELAINVPTGEGLLEFGADQLEQLSRADAFQRNAIDNQLSPVACDVFISYRRKDLALAEMFRTRLRALGVSTYIDLLIPTGERFRSRISTEIRSSKVVLFLWTPEAGHHPWVVREGLLARDHGNLFPVIIQDATPPSLLSGINLSFMPSIENSPRNVQFVRVLDQIWKRCGQPKSEGQPFSPTEIATDFESSIPPTNASDPFESELHREAHPMYLKLNQKLAPGMLKRQLEKVRRSISRHPTDQTIKQLEAMYLERLSGAPGGRTLRYREYRRQLAEDYGAQMPEWLLQCLDSCVP